MIRSPSARPGPRGPVFGGFLIPFRFRFVRSLSRPSGPFARRPFAVSRPGGVAARVWTVRLDAEMARCGG